MNKVHHRWSWQAIIWITGAFCISSTLGFEAIAGLILIYLHLQKLSNRHQIRTTTLPFNYVINTILKSRHSKNTLPHYLFLENVTSKQQLKIKSFIVDANNYLNGIFPSFDSLNSEFSPRFRLIVNFSNQFFFHQANHKDKESKETHIHNLDNIFSNTSLYPKSIIVVLDTSVRNNIAMSISHVHSSSNDVRKTIHHAINVTSTKPKLFTIRCGINQAIQISEATCIIIIMNAIHAGEYIFDSSIHLY